MKSNICDLIRNKLLPPFYYGLPNFDESGLDEILNQNDLIQYIFFSIPDCFK